MAKNLHTVDRSDNTTMVILKVHIFQAIQYITKQKNRKHNTSVKNKKNLWRNSINQ